MPGSKRNVKKDLLYRLKKLLPARLRQKKIVGHPWERAPKDVRFLTTAEVQASLAEAGLLNEKTGDPGDKSRPDASILPATHRKSFSSGKKKSGKITFFKKLMQPSLPTKSRADRRIKKPSSAGKTDRISQPFLSANNIKEIAEPKSESRQAGSLNQTANRSEHSRRHTLRRKKGFFAKLLGAKKQQFREKRSLSHSVPKNNETAVVLNINWKKYLKVTLVSTALFITAFQVSWLLQQLATMITASAFGLASVLYYYEVMFPSWSILTNVNTPGVLIISLAAPCISLVMWTLSRLMISRRVHKGPMLRLFYVWLYLSSIMMFFGSFAAGAFTLEGPGHIFEVMNINFALRFSIALLCLIPIIWLSWRVVRFLPESLGSDSFKNNRIAFLISRMLLPFFAGSIIILIFRYTGEITQHENIYKYDSILLSTLLFAVIPPFFNTAVRPHLNRKRLQNSVYRNTLPYLMIFAAVFILLLFRIGLSHGIYFQLIFDLNLGLYR